MFDRNKHKAVVSTASDGAIEYRFSRPVSHQRAFSMFMAAKDKGLPSGSVVEV